MIEDSHLMAELMKLPLEQRLELARVLIDSAAEPRQKSPNGHHETPLLSLAGRYSGGDGTSSEHTESILEAEINPVTGLSAQ